MIVKSVFVYPDIFAMISGGIMRMNGLWVRFMFRFSSDRFFSSSTMNFSRFASSMHGSQGDLLVREKLHSTSRRSEPRVGSTCESVASGFKQIIRYFVVEVVFSKNRREEDSDL